MLIKHCTQYPTSVYPSDKIAQHFIKKKKNSTVIKKLQVVWVSSDFIVQDLFPYTALLIHLHRCLLGLHIQPQLRFPSGIKDPVFLALSRFITTGNKSVVLFFFSPITPNSRSYRISQKLCLNSETKEIVMSHICILKTHLDLR